MKDSLEFKKEVKLKLENEIDEINNLVDKKNLELSKMKKGGFVLILLILFFVVTTVVSLALSGVNSYFLYGSLSSFIGALAVSVASAIECIKEIEIKAQVINLVNRYYSLSDELEKVNSDILKNAIESGDYAEVDDNIISDIPSMELMKLYDLLAEQEDYKEAKVPSKTLKK